MKNNKKLREGKNFVYEIRSSKVGHNGGDDVHILLCFKSDERDQRPRDLEERHKHALDRNEREQRHIGARLREDSARAFARPEHREREHEDVREAGPHAHRKPHEDGVGELVCLGQLDRLVLEPLQQVIEAYAHGLLDNSAQQNSEPGVVLKRAYCVP